MNNRWLLILISGLFLTTSTGVQALAPSKWPTHDESLPYPPVVNQVSDVAQLKRGEYLTKMGDCIACHTAPGGKAFAGGYPIKTPFGTIYSPNITGDPKTGIGAWTEQDFIHAMREGISPSGHYYYPAFPFVYFNILSDQDLKDIRAYLHAIPAISQVNRKNTLFFPFNIRFLQLGWRILFFHPQGPYQNDSTQSLDWNRGNYLVNGLAHCGMCHTPSYYLFKKDYALAAPRRKYDFTGGIVENYYAPDITHSLLKNVALSEFSKVFLENRRIGGGQLQGPMKEANLNSLKYLKTQDIKAIATYLNSVTTQPLPVAKTATSEKGEGTYQQYCAVCHTTGAGNAPKISDGVAWGPRIKLGLPMLYRNAIHGINGMPPKGMCSGCSDQEIQDAVNYIVQHTQASTAGNTAVSTTQLPILSLADGRKIYDQYCAICHNPGTHYPNTPIIGDEAAWRPRIAQGMDVLIEHTLKGYGAMAPRGACIHCNDAEIKAAVKYLIQNSQTGNDYSLW